MKKTLIGSALVSLTSLCIAQVSNPALKPPPPDRISIFQVPLRCPAAPQIGCGSSAKPILLMLERDAEVSEAWLNRTGMLIAVVWKSKSPARNVVTKLKSQLSAAGCCAHGSDVAELKGEMRAAALKEFQSDGWYRGANVDRLSEEEAGIIATRLVSRLEAKSPLAKDKAKELQEALREAMGKQLIAGNGDENYEREFHWIAGEFLDERQTAILKEAIESGLRPRPDEK